MYCWAIIFALSPFYILMYLFLEMLHWYAMGLSCKPNIYGSWSTSELKVRLAPLNQFKPSSKIVLVTVPRWYFPLVDHLCCFVSCVSHAFASVYCCILVNCWERADLLAFVGDVYLPLWYPRSGVVLDCIVSWYLLSFLLQYQKNSFHLTKVRYDISDIPLVQNKGYKYLFSHLYIWRWSEKLQ